MSRTSPDVKTPLLLKYVHKNANIENRGLVMPITRVVFYQDDDKSVPVLEWLDSLPLSRWTGGYSCSRNYKRERSPLKGY